MNLTAVQDRLFYVMEYLPGGDLVYWIQKGGVFSESRAAFYTAEICFAIWFLHGYGIAYR